MADLDSLQQIQQDFAAHIRDPDRVLPPPKVPAARMQIYNDLVYKNIEGFLSGGFPIVRQLYDDASWQALVRDFVAHHCSGTPYFARIGEEFLAFLSNGRAEDGDDPPYLLELAYYEWVEAALYVADDDIFEDGGEAVDDEALAQEAPIVSPLAWSLQFEYPVHKIGPDYRPESPEPTFLVVYRDRQDEVGFLEINPLTARLIALCQAQEEQPVESGRALLARIAAEMRHPTPEVVVEGGLKTLAQLASLDIIPRTRQVSS